MTSIYHSSIFIETELVVHFTVYKIITLYSPFTLLFSKKRFDMLGQSLVPSITKSVISYSLRLEQQPLITLQIQNFH